jgi:hypothetical protein
MHDRLGLGFADLPGHRVRIENVGHNRPRPNANRRSRFDPALVMGHNVVATGPR